MTTRTANLCGLAALAGWSMNVALTRRLAEADVFGLPAISHLLAGAALIGLDVVRRRPWPWAAGADRRFWLWGGLAFVAYMFLYVYALHRADSRAATLPLGLVNYLWPALILVLLPAFFPIRVDARRLAAGLALCVGGVAAAFLWNLDAAGVARSARLNWPAFAMMGLAAFGWAFYTNAVRKWGAGANGAGWFLFASGLVFLAAWRATGGGPGIDRDTLGTFLVYSLATVGAAYALWDVGARAGDLALLGALANFLPLAAMLFAGWYYGEGVTMGVWVGGLLAAAGAFLCRRSLAASEPAAS